jgi:hypothetical protein
MTKKAPFQRHATACCEVDNMIGAVTVIVLVGHISCADPRTQFDAAVQKEMPCMYYNENVQDLLHSKKPAVTLKRLERAYPANPKVRQLRRIAKLTGYI